MTSKQLQDRANKLRFYNYFAVSGEGLGGNLAMLWNFEINIEIQSFSKHYEDAIVHSENERY